MCFELQQDALLVFISKITIVNNCFIIFYELQATDIAKSFNVSLLSIKKKCEDWRFYWRCQLNLILTGLHEDDVTFTWEKPQPMRNVVISAAVDSDMRQSEDAYL